MHLLPLACRQAAFARHPSPASTLKAGRPARAPDSCQNEAKRAACNSTQSKRQQLQSLPTPARPRLDPADVVVPDGYDVDVVVAGLSFPTGMGFADDGPLDPSGSMKVFAVDYRSTCWRWPPSRSSASTHVTKEAARA